MRRNIVICLALVALVSGCAYQGTIVEKRFRPIPFPASLGLDAMYNFQLRDSTSQIHSQMVTPDVFASYRVGDNFNDLESPPAQDEKELEGFRLLPREMNEGPYQPVRVMQVRPPEKAAAKIAVHAPDHAGSAVKIPRWQTVRIVQLQSARTVAAKVSVPAQDQVESAMKIPRWQTVRIVQLQPPETAAAKVAIHAPDQLGNVKILRWQAVRIVQIPLPEKAAAKVAIPAHQQVKSAVKTATSHHPGKPAAKVAHHKKKKAKVVTAHRKHHRETVASLN